MAAHNLDYRCYNQLYPLYAKKVNKGLGICRVADDARIATVAVRDLSVLAQFQWDLTTGRRMTIFYKDGSARVYDAFQAGKLLALLRLSNTRIDGAIWDRIDISIEGGETLQKFDHDVLKAMPKMIRFARDTRQIYILPYEPPNRAWRLTTEEQDGVKCEKNILDVHIVHQEDNGLVLMLNGDFILRLEAGPSDSALRDMTAARHGLYHCFFQDATVKSLNLGRLIRCEATTQLIEHFIVLKQLVRYLQDHLDLIKKDLAVPYAEFLDKICDSAYGYPILYEDLQSLLLAGGSSVELENWLCYTVGEKNSKKWRKMGLEMYQKAVQILTLSFIPACERLILLSERCRAHLKALQLTETSAITEFPLLASLTSLGQACLRTTIETIQGVSAQEVLFRTFLEWFDDRVHEALDEDYKPKLLLDSNGKIGYEISTYLGLRINPDKQSEYDNKILRLDSFQHTLISLSEALQLARAQDIEPTVLHKITSEPRQSVADSDNQRLLAVAPIPAQSHIVCFLSNTSGQLPSLLAKVLDMSTLTQASAEVPIEVPFGLRDLSEGRVRIVRLTSVSEEHHDHTHRTNSTNKSEIVFTVSASRTAEAQDHFNAAAGQEEFTVRCQVTPAGVLTLGQPHAETEQ